MRLAAAVELEQEGEPVSAELDATIAVGGECARERCGGAALAPPLAQTATGLGRLAGEAGEELVDGEQVRELAGAGERERAVAAPGELLAGNVELGGNDAGAGLGSSDASIGGRRRSRPGSSRSACGVSKLAFRLQNADFAHRNRVLKPFTV